MNDTRRHIPIAPISQPRAALAQVEQLPGAAARRDGVRTPAR